jgi:flagellar hook-basal body complex protein FliE
MNELDPIAAIGAGAPAASSATEITSAATREVANTDFSRVLMEATQSLEARVEHADAMVRRFVVDDSTPIHEVTIALEEARIAVELALQVRTRVVESYRDLANMQL